MGVKMKENKLVDLSMDFAVKIMKTCENINTKIPFTIVGGIFYLFTIHYSLFTLNYSLNSIFSINKSEKY